MSIHNNAREAMDEVIRDAREVGRGKIAPFTASWEVVVEAFPSGLDPREVDGLALNAWCRENGVRCSRAPSGDHFYFSALV